MDPSEQYEIPLEEVAQHGIRQLDLSPSSLDCANADIFDRFATQLSREHEYFSAPEDFNGSWEELFGMQHQYIELWQNRLRDCKLENNERQLLKGLHGLIQNEKVSIESLTVVLKNINSTQRCSKYFNHIINYKTKLITL